MTHAPCCPQCQCLEFTSTKNGRFRCVACGAVFDVPDDCDPEVDR